jgi:hypothetical protein
VGDTEFEFATRPQELQQGSAAPPPIWAYYYPVTQPRSSGGGGSSGGGSQVSSVSSSAEQLAAAWGTPGGEAWAAAAPAAAPFEGGAAPDAHGSERQPADGWHHSADASGEFSDDERGARLEAHHRAFVAAALRFSQRRPVADNLQGAA